MMSINEHTIYLPLGCKWERVEMSVFHWQSLILNHGWAGADPEGDWLGAMVTGINGNPGDANWRPLDLLVAEIRAAHSFVLNGEHHSVWSWEDAA